MTSHRLPRSVPVWILLAVFLAVGLAADAGALESIYFVRHAEKEEPWPDGVGKYQPLTPEGRERAQLWAKLLADKDLGAVYSSPISRTVQTAVHISETLDLELILDERTIQKPKLKDFLREMRLKRFQGKAVLIVGHSNTIPYFLRHFGADGRCVKRLTLYRSGRYELIKGYDGLFKIDLTKRKGCRALSRTTMDQLLAEHGPNKPIILSGSASGTAASSTASGSTTVIRHQLEPGTASGGTTPTFPSTTFPSQDEVSDLAPRPIRLDSDQLVAASRRYRVIYGRESMGVANIELVPKRERLDIHWNVDIGQAGIRQEATVTLSPDGGWHRRVTMQGPMGPSEADVLLKFDPWGRAVGHSDFPRSRDKPQGKLDIQRKLPVGTFERNALFALLPAMPIDRLKTFTIYGYDARDDSLAAVDLKVEGPQASRRFGGVDAYRVELTGMAPGYVVWIHADTPRHVLGIEWEGQSWAYELLPEKP